jgi:lysozyme
MTDGDSSLDPLEALLVKHEGLKLSPYRDANGFLTVGVGHNLAANPIVPEPTYPLTVDRCYDILRQDINIVEDQLSHHFSWYVRVDSVRASALVDLCFNVGIEGLLGFNAFLGYCQLANWNAAAGDLLTTLYAKQVPTRAQDLAGMLNTGKWPALR